MGFPGQSGLLVHVTRWPDKVPAHLGQWLAKRTSCVLGARPGPEEVLQKVRLLIFRRVNYIPASQPAWHTEVPALSTFSLPIAMVPVFQPPSHLDVAVAAGVSP